MKALHDGIIYDLNLAIKILRGTTTEGFCIEIQYPLNVRVASDFLNYRNQKDRDNAFGQMVKLLESKKELVHLS